MQAMNRRSLQPEKADHQPTKRISYIPPKETKNARATLFPCKKHPPRHLSSIGPCDDDNDDEQQKNKLRIVGRLSPADDQQHTAVGSVEIINKASGVGTLRPVARRTNSPEVLRRGGGCTGQRPSRNAVSMYGELLVRSDSNALHQRHCQDIVHRKVENYCRSLAADKGDRVECGSRLTVIGGAVEFGSLSSSVADVTTGSDFMNCSDSVGANSRPQPLVQSESDVGVSGGIRYNSVACCAGAQSDDKEGGNSEEKLPDSDTSGNAAGRMKEESAVVVTNETVDVLRKDQSSTDAQQCSTSPSLRMKPLRRPAGARIRSDGSKSASPSPGASPVLPTFSTSGSGTDDTASIGDDGSGDDDEDDDGVYDETFRYSAYKYIADDDVIDFESASNSPTLDPERIEKHQDGRVGSSSSESILYNCSEKKNHHRSLSMTTPEVKWNGDGPSKMLSRKVIKRHESMGAETYQAQSERVYNVERTLILQKPDSVASYGFHILGQNPMVISTVEPGSAAEFGHVQVGDRLVTINGTNVIKAKESTVIDLVLKSPCRLELGMASGSLSRDICICSGYLTLKPEGIMRNWKKRWCELKYDGFLYFYKTEQCINPLEAISLSNYIIIRGTDCSRTCMFKLVKYGQKTYYLLTESEEDMNRWASHINMATSMAKNMLCDTWLDISSHNVRLPALSIKNPDCHGFLTKVGNHKKNWRRRYCVLKTACLYYYKDQTSSTAKGVAHLHGYTIEEETVYHRRFGFMAVPPVPQMRTFHFTADNETDMQRWTTALRSSIGRWVKVEG